MRYGFTQLHPSIQLGYYLALLIFSLWLQHPLALLVAVIGMLLSLVILQWRKKTSMLRIFLFPLLCFLPIMLINIFFRNFGSTHVLSLPWGKIISTEMLMDAAVTGSRLSLTVFVFLHMYECIESDRLIFLFSRFPRFSVVLTLMFRFLPRFTLEATSLRDVNKVRFGNRKYSLRKRLQLEGSALAGLTGWAMESSIRTADSMEARGFAAASTRTKYKTYILYRKDVCLAVILLICVAGLAWSILQGALQASTYPILSIPHWKTSDSWALFLIGILYFLPVILELGGIRNWTVWPSRI